MSVTAANKAVVSQTGLAALYSYVLSLVNVDYLALHAVYTDATPSAKTFADADVTVVGDLITKTAHGLFTGLKVAATTAGVLPAGLSATNYWVIKLSADTFKLASSLANSAAGTAVDITAAAGGGTHTLTPATLVTTGVVIKLQGSNDGTNFADVKDSWGNAATVTVTVDGHTLWEMGRPTYRWLRVLSTPSTGAINLTITDNAENVA